LITLSNLLDLLTKSLTTFMLKEELFRVFANQKKPANGQLAGF